MLPKKPPVVVAGIDVGGIRKGLHAVALKDGAYHGHCPSKKLVEILQWCRDTVNAQVIAIDAPCGWSTDGRARPAELELMQSQIWCFATPTRETAVDHPTNHYGWMLHGEELFRALESTHPLCRKRALPSGKKAWCFETFPHAVTSALGTPPVLAQNKRTDRKALLQKAGIEIGQLTNMDLVDAAICAMTAHLVVSGAACKNYGEPATGFLIVPTTLQAIK